MSVSSLAARSPLDYHKSISVSTFNSDRDLDRSLDTPIGEFSVDLDSPKLRLSQKLSRDTDSCSDTLLSDSHSLQDLLQRQGPLPGSDLGRHQSYLNNILGDENSSESSEEWSNGECWAEAETKTEKLSQYQLLE